MCLPSLLRITTIKSYGNSHLSANSESDVGRNIRILPAICEMSSKNNPHQVPRDYQVKMGQKTQTNKQ